MMSKWSAVVCILASVFAVISLEQVEEFRQVECGEFNHVYDETSVAKNRWPFVAALLLRDEKRFFCGGSLISTNHILTAAHCLHPKLSTEPIDAANVLVYLGKHNLSDENEPGAVAVNAFKFHIHSDWNPEDKVNYDADIAVIQLERIVERQQHIYPVCLWISYHNLFETDDGIVAGW
jgi:secreted trypsin-like serine protease